MGERHQASCVAHLCHVSPGAIIPHVYSGATPRAALSGGGFFREIAWWCGLEGRGMPRPDRYRNRAWMRKNEPAVRFSGKKRHLKAISPRCSIPRRPHARTSAATRRGRKRRSEGAPRCVLCALCAEDTIMWEWSRGKAPGIWQTVVGRSQAAGGTSSCTCSAIWSVRRSMCSINR